MFFNPKVEFTHETHISTVSNMYRCAYLFTVYLPRQGVAQVTQSDERHKNSRIMNWKGVSVNASKELY
jgi:hypothetical protein